MFNKFESFFKQYCTQPEKCLKKGDFFKGADGTICLETQDGIMNKEVFSKFSASYPVFIFELDNEVKYVWQPLDYFYLSNEGRSSPSYCIGVVSNINK
jgi:hypothetical protein